MALKCIVTYLLVNYGILAFPLGQLVYAVVLLAVYAVKCPEWPFDQEFRVAAEVQKATKAYLGLGLLKFFLSEGEKLIMTLLRVGEVELGVYALVSNLGSIVCRTVFFPIEEVVFTLFSKDLPEKEVRRGVSSVLRVM